jgi:hypothetical protein
MRNSVYSLEEVSFVFSGEAQQQQTQLTTDSQPPKSTSRKFSNNALGTRIMIHHHLHMNDDDFV